MPQVKQPKPFLKRGTRKYLSNATVRSLNQKPNIVDFGEEEQAPIHTNLITNTFKKESNDFKVEIKVNSKLPIKKEPQTKDSNQKAKQNKNINEDKNINLNTNQIKKKNTGLDDYIVVKNNRKENVVRESNSRQKQIPQKISYHNQPKASMVGILKRQDEHLSDEDEEQQFKPQNKQVKINNSNSKHQTASNSRKAINVDLQQQSQKINFNSDSEEQAPKPKNKIVKPPQVFPKAVQRKSKWDEDQIIQEKQPQQPKGPSKILQKFYKKQPEIQANQKFSQPQKKLITADIPKQLKQQIFNELLAQKHSDFTKKLDQLHASIQKSKKERQTLQEGTKQLNKEKEQFQKQMEKRRKEFEEKISAENGKLAREKRYLKDHQTNGKVDWRIKNQVQQLRSKLDQSQGQKKKIKADLSRQIDRLKKKLQQQEHENDILKGQIRCIQMQKIQLKQKTKQVQKKSEGSKLNQIVRYWQDAPTHSYVSNFLEDNFTLISLDPRYYNYQNLEYYIYYTTKKDQEGELISQEKDQSGSKITRRYKNGKEETQLVSKSLKETFPPPFRFTIIHHANGDLKMILPQGIHIYFDSRSQITEWKINPDKVLYNFHQRKQIEMKYKGRRSGEIKQIYKVDMLVLMHDENGQITRFKRSKQGEIARIG